ncbi:hypothetical protein B484DRAFT_133838 [Ochromonadaceae sp. CCMP2298]|nr:hypothetical protein B484DRAFT_133838 [Ochromonadaceae sp. CCMP2298]
MGRGGLGGPALRSCVCGGGCPVPPPLRLRLPPRTPCGARARARARGETRPPYPPRPRPTCGSAGPRPPLLPDLPPSHAAPRNPLPHNLGPPHGAERLPLAAQQRAQHQPRAPHVPRLPVLQQVGSAEAHGGLHVVRVLVPLHDQPAHLGVVQLVHPAQRGHNHAPVGQEGRVLLRADQSGRGGGLHLLGVGGWGGRVRGGGRWLRVGGVRGCEGMGV